MPLYVFFNELTEEEFEDIMTISEKEKFLKESPHIRQRVTSFGIVSGVGSIDSKTDNTWKEVLQKVAEAHPDSDVGNRYGKKNHKQIKTQEVLKKHRKKWNEK